MVVKSGTNRTTFWAMPRSDPRVVGGVALFMALIVLESACMSFSPKTLP